MNYLAVPFLNTRRSVLRTTLLGLGLHLTSACGDETPLEPFSPGTTDASVITALPDSSAGAVDSGGWAGGGTTGGGTTGGGAVGGGNAGGATSGGGAPGGSAEGGITAGGSTGGMTAGTADAGNVVRDAGSDASSDASATQDAGAFLGGLFGGGGQPEPVGDAGAKPHDPSKNPLDPKGNVNQMLPPKADNPKECPSLAPPNPVGDCLGLPIYVICGYGSQGGAQYTCTCDWYHWLCI
jgi:hypothetical protein